VYDAKAARCVGGSGIPASRKNFARGLSIFCRAAFRARWKASATNNLLNWSGRHLAHHPPFEAPGQYLVFKRWDKLAPDEQPLAVVFFAAPDVLSGLFTLANFDVADPHGVVAPMGSRLRLDHQLPLRGSAVGASALRPGHV